jgi:Tol biopolymer transport system component
MSALSPLALAGGLATFVLVTGCSQDAPTAPADFARGGAAATLVASPASLALSLPAAGPTPLTASVQYAGPITARSSNAACATVSPGDAPASKPRGSSVYVARFDVTPVGAGTCTISLTDKRGGTVQVPVLVRYAIPSDGSRLLVTSNRDGDFDLYLSDPDGANVTPVTTGDADETTGAISPDGTTIVYASTETGTSNLFLVGADGNNRRQLTFYDFGESFGAVDPVFSPDGSQIAFSLFRGFGFPNEVHIWVMAAEPGATPGVITAGSTFDRSPRYAPDGRIVFVSAGVEDLWSSIWIMAGNGASPTRLTNQPSAGDGSPSVSPDGSTIAFSRGDGVSDSEIWLMDIDGQHQRALTANSISDGSPLFSPSGEWLAFASLVGGAADVLMLKLGRPESEAWNVTNSSTRDFPIDWR